jgi:hypothetical protein
MFSLVARQTVEEQETKQRGSLILLGKRLSREKFGDAWKEKLLKPAWRAAALFTCLCTVHGTLSNE